MLLNPLLHTQTKQNIGKSIDRHETPTQNFLLNKKGMFLNHRDLSLASLGIFEGISPCQNAFNKNRKLKNIKWIKPLVKLVLKNIK